jgi:hypothetical protein
MATVMLRDNASGLTSTHRQVRPSAPPPIGAGDPADPPPHAASVGSCGRATRPDVATVRDGGRTDRYAPANSVVAERVRAR